MTDENANVKIPPMLNTRPKTMTLPLLAPANGPSRKRLEGQTYAHASAQGGLFKKGENDDL
jgi:hypothetical protein